MEHSYVRCPGRPREARESFTRGYEFRLQIGLRSETTTQLKELDLDMAREVRV